MWPTGPRQPGFRSPSPYLSTPPRSMSKSSIRPSSFDHTFIGYSIHVADRTAPDVREIDRLNEWIRWAIDHTRLQPRGQNEGWLWIAATETPRTSPEPIPFGLIVHSATDLLRSPDVALLRLCANERCGWLFLDRSRKQNRRWCEMRECGARAKARRYRSRRQNTAAQSESE